MVHAQRGMYLLKQLLAPGKEGMPGGRNAPKKSGKRVCLGVPERVLRRQTKEAAELQPSIRLRDHLIVLPSADALRRGPQGFCQGLLGQMAAAAFLPQALS